MGFNLLANGAWIGVVTVLVVYVLRRWTQRLKGHKWGTRGLAVLVCALTVVVAEWVPDQQMTLEEFFKLFWASLPQAQLEYSWIMKKLDKLA